MATSNSTNWNATRNQIIRMAALDIRAIGAGVTMGAQMLADFDFSLNAMVKAWQASGIHVWTTQEATLFPQVGQIKYQLGNSSPDHATQSYVSTTLSAAEASGQTELSVSAVTGITAADYIGVVLDDGTLHWSTVASVGASAVTLDDATTGAAASGNAVYAYTTKIDRPLKVVDARRYDVVSANDTPITPMSRRDYQALPQKTQAGTINQCWYDPGRDTGYLYIWQKPADVTNLVKFTWHRPLQDFDAAGDNPDLPVEWVQTLRYNLAESMLSQFPVPPSAERRVIENAAKYLGLVMDFDREEGSLFFQPDMGH